MVDDGSTDESVNIVKRYGNAIKLFQIRNSGVSAARNHGIRAARGEFICFLDSDDTREPKKYRCSLKKFLIMELDWYIQV